MATQTKSTQSKSAKSKGAGNGVEQAADRVRELNDRITARAREAGTGYLDAYEKALERILEFQEAAAGATQIEWIGELANAQAKLIRDVTAVYTGPARELLK